jgi:hypothetical protein
MVGLGYDFVSGGSAGGTDLSRRPADDGRVAGHTYIAWCLAAVSLSVLAGLPVRHDPYVLSSQLNLL